MNHAWVGVLGVLGAALRAGWRGGEALGFRGIGCWVGWASVRPPPKVVLVAGGIAAFVETERCAKRTGRLKRGG